MKNKRTLLITENLGSGGAERQLTGLAVLLKNKGYIVKVITYVENQFYETYLLENGIDYALVPKLRNKYTRVFYIVNELRQYNPDIIVSFLPSVNLSMCLSNFFYRAKLIVSERTHTMSWNFSSRFRFLLYCIADYVVANSYSEKENISSHCSFLKDKVLAIPNFINIDKFIPRYKIKNHQLFTIVSVGRVIPEKNILRYIEAINLLKDKGFLIKYTWVGSHYNVDYVSRVKSLIHKYHLEDVFELKDHTTNIVEYYQEASAFCLPSLYEGYPNVLCEAMSCALPVICSNTCEMPNIVHDGENGYLFNPYDVNSIASAVEKIYTLSNERLTEMGKTNRMKVKAENSTEKFVNRYIELF